MMPNFGEDNAFDPAVACEEPLLEPHMTNLSHELPRKPRINSADRACLLVFCIVGLSVCFAGPTLLYRDPSQASFFTHTVSTTSATTYTSMPLHLTWHAWEEPWNTSRPAMTSVNISSFPPFPIYQYVFYSTILDSSLKQTLLGFSDQPSEMLVFLLDAGNLVPMADHEGGSAYLTSAAAAPTLILVNPLRGHRIRSVLIDDVPPMNWTCTPGLVGEQLQIFNPPTMHLVTWALANATHGHVPFTWFRASFDGPPRAQRVLRLRGHGLTRGHIYFNGVSLGRYCATAARLEYTVTTQAENVIVLVEELTGSIATIDVTLSQPAEARAVAETETSIY
ncbi:Aste57867_16275 [Aphanomyces stellatus]|uniref:Aste57867_16275 protein n=1 Tax=Aphanomyces stellatus TaxID=120398 RepID=A0A485L6B3_9STRA|nr:hypothetical protein As57867_016218 [Aphanomyces stellatus]VFT93051.1 Aste57867_16275 [Aphanomyces stellatus]